MRPTCYPPSSLAAPSPSRTTATVTTLLFRPLRLSPCIHQPWRGGRHPATGHHARAFTSTTLARRDEGEGQTAAARLPFRFDSGVALFAKRTPRPFPPPFNSPPSASFSDALSTHNMSRDRRAYVGGELIRGQTNGDDAIYTSDYFICANDGVGAWAARPRGHAGLWSRLVIHFWASEVDDISTKSDVPGEAHEPEPITALQTAFERTVEAAGEHDWQGTTTTCGAQLHYILPEGSNEEEPSPVLYVTNLGDCQVMVLRPRDQEVIFKTKEQWHWFDCPRQLGTNSPDTPKENAVTDVVDLQVGDVVLAMTDGVIDNLWEHEIVDTVLKSIQTWESDKLSKDHLDRSGGRNGGMKLAAQELVAAAKQVALDPFAECPYMEHAIEEGLASEGGKLDDISVVAALCVRADEHVPESGETARVR